MKYVIGIFRQGGEFQPIGAAQYVTLAQAEKAATGQASKTDDRVSVLQVVREYQRELKVCRISDDGLPTGGGNDRAV